MHDALHSTPGPSPWIVRWQHLLPAGSRVLDLACGSGRHVRWLAERGFALTAVDRDAQALAPLRELAEVVEADLEGADWPFGGRSFDGIVVTNYLWRPLWPHLLAALRSGGVLLYETFAAGNETVGRPARPEFLLRTGELLALCRPLRVVAFEDGFLTDPPRFVQRIAAVNPDPSLPGPPRLALAPPG
jgi:SAM-dependent methyltransferase